MQVVAMNKVRDAQEKYPSADGHLNGWLQILSNGEFFNESSLKETFGNIQNYKNEYRFPLPETTLMVHTLINFEAQVALIKSIQPGKS
ncbi:hypothetical protein ACUR5C_13495 [Aliikangiella sp. IMCC44653]